MVMAMGGIDITHLGETYKVRRDGNEGAPETFRHLLFVVRFFVESNHPCGLNYFYKSLCASAAFVQLRNLFVF